MSRLFASPSARRSQTALPKPQPYSCGFVFIRRFPPYSTSESTFSTQPIEMMNFDDHSTASTVPEKHTSLQKNTLKQSSPPVLSRSAVSPSDTQQRAVIPVIPPNSTSPRLTPNPRKYLISLFFTPNVGHHRFGSNFKSTGGRGNFVQSTSAPLEPPAAPSSFPLAHKIIPRLTQTAALLRSTAVMNRYSRFNAWYGGYFSLSNLRAGLY